MYTIMLAKISVVMSFFITFVSFLSYCTKILSTKLNIIVNTLALCPDSGRKCSLFYYQV